MLVAVVKNTRRTFIYLLLAALSVSRVSAEEEIVTVTMVTSYGDVQIELNTGNAPLSANNFLRYVDGGHYDGSTFYRTVRYDNDNGQPKIEVIQGGRGDADAPFPPIGHESTDQTGILHTEGVISMARDGVGTATSEFFICIGDQPGLDFGATRNPDKQGFAAFGKVVSGMDVIRHIHQLPSDAPTDSAYVAGQIIEEPAVIETIRRTQ